MQVLIEQIKASNNLEDLQISFGILKIVLEKYSLEMEEKRQPLKVILQNVFPFLENIVTCRLDMTKQLDLDSKTIILQMLKCFYSTVFVTVEEYFTPDIFKIWMFFIKKCLDLPVLDELLKKPSTWEEVQAKEKSVDWKIKRFCMMIVNK